MLLALAFLIKFFFFVGLAAVAIYLIFFTSVGKEVSLEISKFLGPLIQIAFFLVIIGGVIVFIFVGLILSFL